MFCLFNLKQLNFSDQLFEFATLSYGHSVKLLKLLKKNFDINPFIP